MWRVMEIHKVVRAGQFPNCSTLAKAIEVMVAELDQIDGLIAQVAPDINEALRLAILNCVTTARNKIASRGASLVVAALEPGDNIDADLDGLDD